MKKLEKFYHDNKIGDSKLKFALDLIFKFQTFIEKKYHPMNFDDITTKELDDWIVELVKSDECIVDAFVAMMRYFRLVPRNDLFIHLTKYTGKLNVIESIYEKLEKTVGTLRKNEITKGLDIPKLGMRIVKITEFTEALVERLKEQLNEKELLDVLTDNHHQIPRSAFQEEREKYETSDSLEAYLKDLHLRHIEELEQHLKAGKIWFEQEITQDVIDFVKSNQEILSAVLDNETLYITKIPYDTNKYLEAKTPQEKSYHACHCPFAKEAILNNGGNIDSVWCYCSAGFSKFPFEVALNQDLPIVCLSSALRSDPICRFSISLKNINYKK